MFAEAILERLARPEEIRVDLMELVCGKDSDGENRALKKAHETMIIRLISDPCPCLVDISCLLTMGQILDFE